MEVQGSTTTQGILDTIAADARRALAKEKGGGLQSRYRLQIVVMFILLVLPMPVHSLNTHPITASTTLVCYHWYMGNLLFISDYAVINLWICELKLTSSSAT